MQKNRLRIGYIPVRRQVFSAPAAVQQRDEILAQLRAWDICELVDIDGINDENLLFDDRDLDTVVARMQQAQVDGLFFPHCNFGNEALVAQAAARLQKPVLLWGPRDEAPNPDGTRSRDTQCGLFATGKILRRCNVPFTYLVNSHVTDDAFCGGFENFVAVCGVVRAFRGTRILQVSTRPDSFWTMMCNEGELLERFGIQVHPVSFVDLEERVQHWCEQPQSPEFVQANDYLQRSVNCNGTDAQALTRLVALYLALIDMSTEYRCSAVAIQCWFSMQKKFGIMPCIVNGLLTEQGIPTVCETDLHGAVSSILLQHAANCTRPVFFADMTVRHPDNDNAELLWHCGNFPPSLAKDPQSAYLDKSFILDSQCAGTGCFEIRGGEVTVCRFDGDHGDYRLLLGEGHGTQGPINKGSYLWLEVGDWPMWERRLVMGPYVHHCTAVHGRWAHILLEACKYIPGLTADVLEPHQAVLEARFETICR